MHNVQGVLADALAAIGLDSYPSVHPPKPLADSEDQGAEEPTLEMLLAPAEVC